MTIKLLAVGHTCLDIVHNVTSLPTPDIKIPSFSLTTQIGGNAANFAVAAVELGATADITSILGSLTDPFTNVLVELLKSKLVGINCKFLESEDCPVSSVMVLPNGDRALTSYQPEAIVNEVYVPADIVDYNMIVGDTYRLPIVKAIFKIARELNIPTMLDIDKPIDRIWGLPKSDIVMFSHEAFVAMNLSEKDFPSFQKHFGGVVGVTNGPEPIKYISPSGQSVWHKINAIENPINTLGAGDVFRASLAINLCLGKPIDKSLESAANSAAEHIMNKPLTKIIEEEDNASV